MSTRQTLDTKVAQALYALRGLERALHSAGPFSIRWNGIEVPALREVTDEGVVFRATFPEMCWLDAPDPCLTLLDGGEVVGVKAMGAPGDTGFVVSWTLGTRIESLAKAS